MQAMNGQTMSPSAGTAVVHPLAYTSLGRAHVRGIHVRPEAVSICAEVRSVQ